MPDFGLHQIDISATKVRIIFDPANFSCDFQRYFYTSGIWHIVGGKGGWHQCTSLGMLCRGVGIKGIGGYFVHELSPEICMN